MTINDIKLLLGKYANDMEVEFDTLDGTLTVDSIIKVEKIHKEITNDVTLIIRFK